MKPRVKKLVPVETDEEDLPPAPPVLTRQTGEIEEKAKRVRKSTKKMAE